MSKIKCFLLIPTGKMVESESGVSRPLYVRADNGRELTLNMAPVGAMWDADWYHDVDFLTGPDGHSYIVKTPGGEWCIDGKATNCGLPEDNVHKCWVRHGEAPDFTVDKNGHTCSAGAGSIQIGNYHGFLIDGYLVEC